MTGPACLFATGGSLSTETAVIMTREGDFDVEEILAGKQEVTNDSVTVSATPVVGDSTGHHDIVRR